MNHADIANQSADDFFMTHDTSQGMLHFPVHHHDADELMWARTGRLDLTADGRRFSLGQCHVAWIPARTRHEATLLGEGDLICLLAAGRLRPTGERWTRAQVLTASPLTGQVLTHLNDAQPSRRERRKCCDLLTELIGNAPDRQDALAIPRDTRAALVAQALLAGPADRRTIEEWATTVSVSPATLARLFRAEAGMSFGAWRTRVRVNHSITLLSRGDPVDAVAAAVGYRTTSSYIETFRHALGSTPAAYRRRFLKGAAS